MEEKQKAESFNIVLSCRGEELYRLNTKDFVEGISIGRSEDCTWSVGHIDSTVSSRHAMISQRKKNFYLTDLGSRNGMYLEDHRVKEVCLEPGMSIHFGECTLSISQPGQRGSSRIRPYYLKYTDDRGRNIKYKLMPGTVKIGNDKKYEIYLSSGLVSSPHASVTRKKDGSCWVRDLKSRNGTEVNHALLPSKHERMLKSGDTISIADTDITFWDASGVHESIHLKMALLTLAATLFVCGLVYLVYQRLTPSSEECLKLARDAARVSDFTKARKMLQDASTARHAASTVASRKQLQSRITTWEHSATNWKAVQDALEARKMGAVLQLLGNMELRFVSAWDWDEEAMVELRKRVELVKNGFDVMVRLMSELKDAAVDLEAIERQCDKLRKVISECDEYKETYIHNMKEECEAHLKFAEKGMEGVKRIDALLLSMGESKTPLDVNGEIAMLEGLRKNAPGILMAKIETVLPYFYAIRRAEEILVKRRELILDMRFAENNALVIDMPQNTMALPSLDGKVNAIKAEDKALMKISQNLETYLRVLKNEEIEVGKNSAALMVFQNAAVLDKVFACDSLSMPLPSRNRSAGQGKYDEVVGIEYLHASLLLVKTYDSVRSRYEIPFPCVLEKAASQVLLMSMVIRFAEENCGGWPLSGELEKYVDYLRTQLRLRDKSVESILSRAGAAGTRQYFIAQGIAVNLNSSLFSFEKRAKLHKEYSALRTKLQEMNSAYNESLAEDAIVLREKILSIGLPGDPVVKRMWSLK